MFKVLILVCAATLPPKDCTPETATDVLQGPDAENEIACGLQSQAYLAQTSLGRNLRRGEYLRVRCRPRERRGKTSDSPPGTRE